MDDIDTEGKGEETDQDDIPDVEGQRLIRRTRRTPKHALSTVQESPGVNGFHSTLKLSLRAIRDALLHHRWEEAADYMSSYSQTLENRNVYQAALARETVWRFGMEILRYHPNSKAEEFAFYEQMKHCGVKNYLKISLEHYFQLLLNGHFEDAKRQLSVAQSWRFGRVSLSQSLELKLINAYIGFMDYFTWCDRKSKVCNADDVEGNNEMHGFFRNASVTLQEIVKQPGVWDPFVLSYVDMLEFYNDHEGALNVLRDYASDDNFPPNPNAHMYLYQFLKRHKYPEKKLIKVLDNIHCLVPSHELMMEYCSLLLQHGCLQDALRVVMSLLEYHSWRSSLEAWSLLLEIIHLLKNKNQMHIVVGEWDTRQGLWVTLHFRAYHARQDAEQNIHRVKADVFKMLSNNSKQSLKYAQVGTFKLTKGKARSTKLFKHS